MVQQGEAEGGWLRRDGEVAVDDAGAVLLAWRVAAGRTQVDVAGMLGMTQQHISQIETGQRPVSLEQRRKMVTELGIAAEELGLLSGSARRLVSPEHASPQVVASQLRWREERRWLNRHRSELARLAVQLYPAEPSFLLHWRDPAKVATAGGIYDVIPAGEFQPSSIGPWDRRNDFDLWRNIVREYSE